jgi:heavy metal sensor kinase
MVLMPVGILAAAIGGYWISRRALAPVDSITSTARVITAQALGRRLDVPATGDELQRLSETLNAMLDRLEASFRETSRFTADASHELRTPIALIRTAAEIALRNERPAHEYRCALENILHEAERMSSLVQDLLTLVRADAGVDGAQRTPLDLRLLLADMSDSLAALCAARNLEFQLDLGERTASVTGDRAALSRLVFIVMDNAVHYTPPPGLVSLSLRCDDRTAVVDVTDTGIGVGAEDMPHVFDRFYRADRARSRDSGGSGLGLSIAKWIAERHGGSIGIKSAPGLGCRVRVELPCSTPAASPSTSAAVPVES